ncbi:MAG: PEP-utilizing enzyme [Desulfobacterales bacterium]|jgi:pyruvate,water dikinase|nr:PEP-utilizing enzyme [Desulfobacterales bacterium]
MKLFAKSDACRLLADPQGPAAKRYLHYAAFLDHNHRALRLLAELELLDRGAGFATLASIRRRAGELLEEVRGLVAALSGLAGTRYQELLPTFQKVAEELAPWIDRRRAAIAGPLTLPFAALAGRHIPLAGAKAVNLARIKNELGLAAPEGFSVTTAAFDLFLRDNRLREPIDAMLAAFDPEAEESDAACRRLRESICAAPLPRALAAAIDREVQVLAARLGNPPLLAVRSSAVGEDGAASFAGQYASVLPVEAEKIAAAYKTVLASKYTPRAITYRLRYGLTDDATPMAVAVVAMIRPRASGVLYTVDPSLPNAGLARIDAAVGAGEQVVGGSASPDVFRVDRSSLKITQRRVQPKPGEPDLQQPTPAVAEETAIALAKSGVQMEAHFGAPQDIEWAEDERGGLFFLQARPLGLAGSAEAPPAPEVSGLKLLLAAGQTASPGRVSGRAVLATPDVKPAAAAGAILIARTAAPELAPLVGRARGLITDLGGAASHLASVAREFNVPALMDTRVATASIAAGREITLLADECKVFEGLVPELARKPPARSADDERGPIGSHLRELLSRISPLNLTDPASAEFSPRGCRSLHDVIRFAHEKAMAEMFNLSELADASVVSRKMSANIPLSIYFIDLGGGLAPELTSCDEILPAHIRSKPMAALWRGLTHPGISWSGAVDISARNFMALMAGSIGPENAAPPQVDSYALVSADYLNLSVKFGYHYSNLDALCSADANANTLTLQFSGGAGTGAGKALRIEFLSQVLNRLGYQVAVRGDMLQAALKGLDRPSMEEILDQTGRLLGCSRLLDLAIPSQTEVAALTELFFNEDYDFLGRSEKRLPGYHAAVGEWSQGELDGQAVIVQNGAGMTSTIACSLHHALDKVLGGRYQKFLENRHARHYYPVAVKRDSRRSGGRSRVDLRIGAGCVDLAAGLAFGLANVGNCLVLAADASAGELQLLEFINNTRHFRARKAAEIPMDRWLKLEVRVAGKKITGTLDGRAALEFTAAKPVEGHVGLWCKGDTTAYFRDLEASAP